MKKAIISLALFLVLISSTAFAIHLNPIGTYESGIFDESAAEIVAHDYATQRLFVINADAETVDVLDISTPTNPTKINELDVSVYGGPNSVACHDGVIAVAVENGESTQEDGYIVFFDADGTEVNSVTAGALPDMLTFTPDGNTILVANEGEPDDDYVVDPEGSVTVVDISNGVENAVATQVMFTAFNDQKAQLMESGVRIFGPGSDDDGLATVAQDLEPEYIAVSSDGETAWVACQENNAFAVLDVINMEITDIIALGTKDHSLIENALDASNRDDIINITTWPVRGFYLPDAIYAYEVGGQNYIISANEGDSRDYDGFEEEERVEDLTLDPTAFPNHAELQQEENLGRLKITTTMGDIDGDGDFDELYSYGARSFTIWNTDVELVYDSKDDFEQITAEMYPNDFNSNNDENDSFDARSDDKGPEPEGVVVGAIGDTIYAFIGLERMGGIMVYDVTNPGNPQFVEYHNNRDFSATEPEEIGDLGPEGLLFIPADESPNEEPLLVVGNEVSGTTTIYEITSDTGIEDIETGKAPTKIELYPNFPNPFNPNTEIRYSVPKKNAVSISIYNTQGVLIKTLVNGEKDAGYHSVMWSGTDDKGENVSSGIYIYKITSGAYSQTKQMTLLK